MSNTIGSLKLMIQNLPDDMDITMEDPAGNQWEPFQMGGACRLNSNSNRDGSYAFDGTDEEENFDYSDRTFLFMCG